MDGIISAMATNQAILTADELLAMGDIGRCELIERELVRMSPGKFEHGVVASRIDRLIGDYAKRHKLGLTTGACMCAGRAEDESNCEDESNGVYPFELSSPGQAARWTRACACVTRRSFYFAATSQNPVRPMQRLRASQSFISAA
ncbi:MAG TPA: Uma2 family endonuclease [Phycisphaerae bacterium]|nr:Uma2 family endonuclease [Phycisphaerae bacterium]